MATLPTVAEAQQSWREGVARSGDKYQRGVDRNTINPMEKAATDEAQNKYRMNTAEASSSGRMSQRLRQVSFETYKKAVRDKGKARYVQSATTDAEKYGRGIGPVLTAMGSVLDQIRAMPTTTYEERKMRATALMDYMHNWKMSRSG